eukprot:XP_014788967.1 PREDICTED: FK506-binding protein 5-like [Octopus bimaculoides]
MNLHPPMNWDADDVVEAFKKFRQKTQLAFKSFLKGTTADEKEEETKVEKEGEICIVSGRKKVICTCFNCFRNWRQSQSKDLPSSQPCTKRVGDVSFKPQFNSQKLSMCKWNDSDEYEPSEKKSKLSDSKSKDQKKLRPTRFHVQNFDFGEVITKSTTQGISDLSKNKSQTTCRGTVIDVSDESSTSVNSDSDDTLPNLTPPMSDNTNDEENDKEETTLVDNVPGIADEEECPEIIDIIENNYDSEVLFNYSQEDAIILISDDDNEVGDGEYDDNDEDEEEEDFDRRGMDGESSKKPHHRNNISFVNANVQFSKEESKFCQEIKKEIPDSLADYGNDVSTKHKIKKEEEEEEAEEHSRHSENSKVNSLMFDIPSVKLEPGSSDKGTGKATRNPEDTQLYHQLHIKQEKPDSQDTLNLFEEWGESTKPNSTVARDKPTNVCVKQDDTSGGKYMEPTIFPLKRKVYSNRFSSSTSDDDDDDTQCCPLKTSKVTKTVSQWLTKQGDHEKSLTKHSVSNDVVFDDDGDAELNDDDELYMCATQVEENLFKEGQLNRKVKKKSPEISRCSKLSQKTPKYSSKTVEDLGEGSSKTARDSLTPVIAKKLFGNANTSTPSLSRVTQKTKGKLWKPCWKNTDEDSDSDSSIYSMATQVDHNIFLVNDNDADNDGDDDDDDDRLYMQNTQVDSVPRKTSFKFKSKSIYSAKSKKLLSTNDNNSDSDDSQFSVATQVDNDAVPKGGHQIKNCFLSPKASASVTNSRQVLRTKESEFKTPKFPHLKKKSKGIPSDAYLKKTMTPTSIQHSSTSYKDVDEDSDSDSSVFSIATQIDHPLPCQNDERKDDPYFQATQVDKLQSNTRTKFPSPKANSFKIPLQPTKFKPSALKLDIHHCKERNEDYDSDDSLFSVATQIDDSCPLRINIEKQEEFYMKETQVDEPFTSKSSKSQHCIPPVHLKPKAPRKNSTSKPKATSDDNDDDDNLFLAATQVDSVNSSKVATPTTDSSFNDFVLGLAATEPSSIGTVSSSVTLQQMEGVEKGEHESDPKFSDFLLKLCEGTDEDESVCPKPVAKASEIEPQRLKSRKEIRDRFKPQQTKMDNKSKPKSPEKSPTKLFHPTNLSIKDSTLPKKKRSSSKNLKETKEKVISEGISSAKNQLEDRFFFMSLDKTPAKWTKSSSVAVDTLKTSPPVVSKDQLFPLLQSYPSYTEYVSVVRPLLLLEIWENVFRDYSETVLKDRILKVACSNVRKASPSHVDYIVYGKPLFLLIYSVALWMCVFDTSPGPTKVL